MNCHKLFQEYKRVYFWTFTFTNVLQYWEYPYRWQGYVHDLVWKVYGGNIGGLRVIECHKDHGLHYHALLNRRLYIRLALQIGKRHGIGRISVSECDLGAAIYLAKYLDKDRFWSPVRLARWHAVGNFEPVRKNDIVINSPFNATLRLYMRRRGLRRISNETYNQIFREYYDLCPPYLLHDQVPTGPVLTPEPTLTPQQLDAVWTPNAPAHTYALQTYPLDRAIPDDLPSHRRHSPALDGRDCRRGIPTTHVPTHGRR